MKPTDQIAAEAASRMCAAGFIKREHQAIVAERIKYAIEKATKEAAQASEPRLTIAEQIRRMEQAAQASEPRKVASQPRGEPPFDQGKHHPSCTANDQDLMWVCAQCGHKEPAK